MKKVPAWLQGLMAETFFDACGVHQNRRKNEKNIFCLNCCLTFCPHCLPSHHPSHPLLQVRRYVYQDVIRLDELEKLIDCSYIQPYTLNSAKVIFLNERAQSRGCNNKGGAAAAAAGGGNPACFTCDRFLQDPFHFCSLSCKVDHMVYQGEDLSSILYYSFDGSDDFAISQFDGLRVQHNFVDAQLITGLNSSILENPAAVQVLDHEYGGSNYETGTSSESAGCRLINVRRDTPAKNKNKGGLILPAGIMLSLSSRRKGAPQRSPLS